MSAEVKLVLLPGLDGTGRLFDRFVELAPALPVTRLALPTDRVLSYDELVDSLLDALPQPPLVLLGESFSGPLALRMAASVKPEAIVLCASYIRASAIHRLAAGPLSLLSRAVLPTSAVRMLLAGGDETLARDLVRAVRTVDPRVVASRVRMVLDVDATTDLAAFPRRVLYLRALQDRVVHSRESRLFGEVRPDGEIAGVAGPHLLLQSRPAECWKRIASFLALAGFEYS